MIVSEWHVIRIEMVREGVRSARLLGRLEFRSSLPQPNCGD